MSILDRLWDYDSFRYAAIYVVLVGALHALLVCAAALVLVMVVPLSGWKTYLRRLRRFLLANALLLAFGVLGNAFWIAFVYRHRYFGDAELIHFYPFRPFGQWALTDHGGRPGTLLNGATLWELRGWWALTAGSVWALTFLIYQRVTKGSLLPKLLRIVRLEELTDYC